MRTKPQFQTNDEWVSDYEGGQQGTRLHPLTNHPEKHATSNAQSMKTRRSKEKPSPKLVMPEEMPALIPEGWYTAKCINQEMAEYWGDPKIIFTFQIIDVEYSGTQLQCFFNVQKKPNTTGGIDYMPGLRGHYMRMLRRVFGSQMGDADSLPQPQELVDRMFNVEVETVGSDHQRNSLDKANRYSKVKTNIELIEDKKNT